MNARRILGLIIIVTAVVGMIISVVGIVAAPDALDRVGDQLDAGFSTASDTLDNLEQSLRLTQDTLERVSASMDTLEQAALNVSKAINDTRPLVKDVGQIATGDVADAVESLQTAVGPLVELSQTIDQLLRTLSELKIEQNVLGIPLAFDLGIEYDPDTSLPESVEAIADSVAGVPESLRVLSTDIETADENLGLISEDLAVIAGDIGDIKSNLSELPGLVDGFSDNVDSARGQIQDIQSKLNDSWQVIKTSLVIFFVWLGFTQLAPLLWGYELLTGRRPGGGRE